MMRVRFNENDAEKYYRFIVSTIGVNIAMAFLVGGAVPEPVIMALYVPFLALYSYFSFYLAKALNRSGVLWAILTAIPIMSFISILILLNRCKNQLKEVGIKIRFFGGY